MNPISNTAFYCCGIRMEDADRKRSVCNDIYAKRFMDEKGMKIFEPFKTEKMPNISNITRCRIIDELIFEEISKNDKTNIITIGAGFDTRPYRLAGGSWTEIDEAQIIICKNEKLPVEECENKLHRISIDFSNESLTAKLSGIDKHLPAVVVIEGVFMYLEPEDISKTIKEIQSLLPHHVLLCDLMSKVFFDKFAGSIHSKIVDAGAEFTLQLDNPKEFFINNNYIEIDAVSMSKRATELGLYWDVAKIPVFVSILLINFFMQDLNEYSVHRFRYG